MSLEWYCRIPSICNRYETFIYLDCFMVSTVSLTFTYLSRSLHSPDCFTVSTIRTYTDLGYISYASLNWLLMQHRTNCSFLFNHKMYHFENFKEHSLACRVISNHIDSHAIGYMEKRASCPPPGRISAT